MFNKYSNSQYPQLSHNLIQCVVKKRLPHFEESFHIYEMETIVPKNGKVS